MANHWDQTYTTNDSPPWEQIGWLKGHIRMALTIIDADVERAKVILENGLAALEADNA